MDPANPEPAAVFAGTPVDIAAAYLSPVSPAQFISNPDANLLRKTGWNVWYSEARPDAVLTTLHAVHGQQAYLVHATADATWRLTGAVQMPAVRWQPDAFNLVGFSVSAQAPPTFAQFFGGSAAHRHNRLYRLVEGTWQRVTDPSAQSMRSGEAFWIYCEGSSRYRGPLTVEAGTERGLVLGSRVAELVVRNASGNPLSAVIENVIGSPGSLPLTLVVRAVGDPAAPVLDREVSASSRGWIQPLPPLEAGGSLRIPIKTRPAEMTSYVQTSVLRLTTDLGAETWVPVVGVREDLKSN